MITTTTVTRRVVKVEERPALDVEEFDKAGVLKATYVESGHAKGAARIDVLLPVQRIQLWRRVLDIFLPDGYPQSVTDDYAPYQIYDSVQAFAGSIAGMISSRAVWEGLGVGDPIATPTGAMLIQIIRECMGKLATITFAHTMGTSIEAECKAYRLKADVLCDIAMLLDCLSPFFPRSVRFSVLCTSSVLFAASGVAGNASKSSLSGHFAKWNNLGELNAKDASQETAISLMGMVAGTLVVSLLDTPLKTWSSLLFLLFVHLFLNYKAVRAVQMRSLNRQRANMVFSALLSSSSSSSSTPSSGSSTSTTTSGTVLTPRDVALTDRIFERRSGSVLRWDSQHILGHCDFGVSLSTLLASLSSHTSTSTGSMRLGAVDLSTLTHLFRKQEYILWCESAAPAWYQDSSARTKVLVVLKEGVKARGMLRAWYHALLLSRYLDDRSRDGNDKSGDSSGSSSDAATQTEMLAAVTATLEHADATFEQHARRLIGAGWDLEVPVLETKSGSRIMCRRRERSGA